MIGIVALVSGAWWLYAVLAADFDNLIARGYMDGNQQFAKVVESNREFRSSRTGIVAEVSYEQEIIGTSRVRTFVRSRASARRSCDSTTWKA